MGSVGRGRSGDRCGVTCGRVAVGLLLWSTWLGFVGACTPERGDHLAWSVGFACQKDGLRTDKVLVEISPGTCPAASPPVYQDAILRGGGSPAVPLRDLAAGQYAFHGVAFDPTGVKVAQGCVSVRLPTADAVALLLVGESTCESAATASDWPRTGGSEDLPEAGVEDAPGVQGEGAGVEAGGEAAELRPRIELARTDILSGEPVIVSFFDLSRAGMPFVGLYEMGSAEPVATFSVPFRRARIVKSGSHQWPAPRPGTYAVRLVHHDTHTIQELPLRVLQDRDGDGTADLTDECPDDPRKVAPGSCGCDFLESERDQDSDGLSDCYDACPGDPAKTKPLQCGCGERDTDTDADGAADCHDACVTDPAKNGAGVCGCGVADTDTDSDGVADCFDRCPSDGAKLVPGTCGCGVSDTDHDTDGSPDCLDSCRDDPAKLAPGVCGCGVADGDQDGDGVFDCRDPCPRDAKKTLPGVCGCGRADNDTDRDGVLDCFDGCPSDPAKRAPLACGCGRADTDTDRDGTMDCVDGCVTDPNKTRAGICGCGAADTDPDRDGFADCVDACPLDPNKRTPASCGCGVAEPFSSADYRDAQGESCRAWEHRDCAQAVSKWKYTVEQAASILENCSRSCRVCPPAPAPR